MYKRQVISSSQCGCSGLEEDAAVTQGILLGLGDGMVIDSDALVQVEAAGQIDGNSYIIGGADINIITQDGRCV